MKTEKPELAAFILIGIGVALLILTFAIACLLLLSITNVSTSDDLSRALGEILGPITESIVKVMFLGIMGWTGSIVTVRGIQLYRESKAILQAKSGEKMPDKA